MTSQFHPWITEDGSHTLVSESFGDSYHSKKGAFTESRYVFIKNGLDLVCRETEEIHLLELGFGTGLNAILSWLFMEDLPSSKLIYDSIEAFPLPEDTWKSMNLGSFSDVTKFHLIHELPWNHWHPLTQKFQLRKRQMSFSDLHESGRYDLVYHDAFAPAFQAEWWQLPFLNQLATAMKLNALLVSYCSQGKFRRCLESLGFVVKKVPGPPGKREMIQARKVK